MSHMKIASKILEVMKMIPNEQAFGKLNEALIEQKLITKVEYEIKEAKERITAQGVVWQLVTVACELTIIDAESDEILVNVAYGSGMDTNDEAVTKAQRMAWGYVWIAALNIEISKKIEVPTEGVQAVTSEPEFVVETPEGKLIAQIKALWKRDWGEDKLESYFINKRGKALSELNLPELTVEKNDLESYIRGNG